jgi:hypothetical protein
MSKKVPHDDFQEGFLVGWQAIKGQNTGIPGIPGQPGTPGNSTPFLEGVKAGLRSAGVKL